MTGQPTPGTPIPTPPPSQGKGCFFWGCMTSLILFVLVGGCVVIVGYGLYQQFRSITSETPVAIPAYELGPGEYEALEKEIAVFTAGAEAGGRLELTADDLNALFKGNPSLKRVSQHAFIRIEGGEVLLDVSLPLDEFVPEQVKRFTGGRYFNGALGVSLSLMNGELVGLVESAEVNGKPVPGQIMKEFQTQNIFAEAKLPRKIQEVIERAKSLVVRDGKIIVER